MDDQLMLMPRGTTARIRDLLNQRDQVPDLTNQRDQAPPSSVRLQRIREVVSILQSTSWSVTAPLRFVARMAGRPATNYDFVWNCSSTELAEIAAALRRSTSWRLTAPLRRLRGGGT